MPEFAPAVLPRFDDYETICRKFQWHIPPDFNIAVAVCDRWAEREPDRVAIVHQHADGRSEAVSYGALRELSNRLANALRAYGIGRGDRVALLLPQMPEVAAVHIAIYKLGAIALPQQPEQRECTHDQPEQQANRGSDLDQLASAPAKCQSQDIGRGGKDVEDKDRRTKELDNEKDRDARNRA